MKIKNFSIISEDLEVLIKWIGREADVYGFKAFIIGGFVRDILLGLKNLDIDIVVEGDGIEFAKNLAADKKAELIKHRQFGTATVIMPDGFKIDIATARKEIYKKPAALPKVSPGFIEDDLFRRDFSINAMAININKNNFGEILDYFKGRKNLKQKNIRVLHDLSFIDDPTRILRAIRFEQRLNFRLERHTYFLMRKALKEYSIDATQPQRIWSELVLLLKEPQPKKYILRLNKICGLDFIHPKIKLDKSLYKLFDSIDEVIRWFHKEFSHRRALDIWLMYFILLIYRLKIKDITHIIKKYNMPQGDQRRIYSFVRFRKQLFNFLGKATLMPSKIFSLLEPLSYEVILLIKAVSNKDIVSKRIEDFFSFYNGRRLHISGKDLIELGIKPGAHFKKFLKKTLYAKIDGKIKTKLDELKFIKRLIEK